VSIKVAIVGVGNCANSLLQGLEKYKPVGPEEKVPGLMHSYIGGYGVGDIEVVAAFDVASTKVGKDVSEAAWARPNDTIKFAELRPSGVVVSRGPTMDGIGKYLRDVVEESPETPVDVADVLRRSEAEVVVNYLPVGSEDAARYYARAALDARCAFVNCIPVFIASDPEWSGKFRSARLPIIGDDIKSQVGATIVHRVLTTLFGDRGVNILRAYQLNVGGNTDFLNMLERSRLDSKKISKTNAVKSVTQGEIGPGDLHVGPSDHVPWLTDRKFAFIRIEGAAFGGVPLELDLHLRVWDSPNSAGVVIDAVRLAKIGLDARIGGPLAAASAYLMKSPPMQMRDDVAREMLEKFISSRGRS